MHEHPMRPWKRLRMAWNWCTWLLLVLLLFMQVLAVIWPTVTAKVHVVFGQQPALGRYTIPGTNDDPFSDRSIVCTRRGWQYAPEQLSEALLKQRSRPVLTANFTTNGIDGYRVIPRQSLSFDPVKVTAYASACSILSEKVSRIFDVCTTLGYANVTRDALRIIDGTDNGRVTILPDTLPVLLLPYWDYARSMRLVIPSTDGSACLFRISFNEVSSRGRDMSTTLSATPRLYRETTTAQWLKSPSGVWRNGWLEDPRDGSRWYADVISSDPGKPYEFSWYDFDLDSDSDWMRGNNCAHENSTCEHGLRTSFWGPQLAIGVMAYHVTSIAISNGERAGFFIFQADGMHVVKSIYSLEKFVSNVTLAGLSFQWLVAMLALSKTRETIGVGALANALSFKILPLLLLPRLQSTFEGFWTAGCRFEGDQMALSESWSVIYPAIGEFVLVYFSVLNTVAKLTRRRMSDALFGPTLLFFALMHYLRDPIGRSNMFGFEGRVSAVVTAAQVEDASFVSFFTTDLIFRINGRVTSLFAIKVAVLALNLVPLVVGSRRVGGQTLKKYSSGVTPVGGESDSHQEHSLETALATIFALNGGLGLSTIYAQHNGKGNTTVVVPYELVRAGFVVVDSASSSAELSGASPSPSSVAIISINSWCWLLAVAPVSAYVDQYLMPRVLVFRATFDSAADYKTPPPEATRALCVDPWPRYCRPGDVHFERLRASNFSAWATK